VALASTMYLAKENGPWRAIEVAGNWIS
jgi:hypothetical protein